MSVTYTGRGGKHPEEALILEKPAIELVIRETGWQPWTDLFARWHYLHGIGPMAFSTAYTGYVNDTPACFIGMSAMVAGRRRVARACRMVVLPEWMGAGIGTNFLDFMAERELRGEGFVGQPVPTIFHTAHPALCAVLRHKKDWRQVSSKLFGEKADPDAKLNWGGHFRAVAGFKYYGQRGIEAAKEESSK